MEVNSTTSQAGAATASGSGVSLAETFDNFLLLLTTQLENQDPLSPLDTNQFTEQLVQFSAVEQAISTNSKLDELIAVQSANLMTDSLGYLGKTVEIEGTQLDLTGDGATIVYDLAANAQDTSIEILGASGQVLRTLDGPGDLGRNEVVWDGTDSRGNALPEGSYSFAVSAVDQSGDTVALTQGSIGTVSGVEVVDGLINLSVGEMDISISQIMAVRENNPV